MRAAQLNIDVANCYLIVVYLIIFCQSWFEYETLSAVARLDLTNWTYYYFFASSAFALVVGIFIDKVGRKSGLLVILTTMLVVCLLLAFIPETTGRLSMTLRILLSIESGLLVISRVLVTELSPPNNRSWAVSVFFFVRNFAFVTKREFSSMAWDLGTSSTSFIFFMLSGLLIIMIWGFLPETLSFGREGVRIRANRQRGEGGNTHSYQPAEVSEAVGDQIVEEERNNDIEELMGNEVIDVENPENIDSDDELTVPRLLDVCKIGTWKRFWKSKNIRRVIVIEFFMVMIMERLVASEISAGTFGSLGEYSFRDLFQDSWFIEVQFDLIILFGYPFLEKRIGDLLILKISCHLIWICLLLFSFTILIDEPNFLRIWVGVIWLLTDCSVYCINCVLLKYTNDLVICSRRGRLNSIGIVLENIVRTLNMVAFIEWEEEHLRLSFEILLLVFGVAWVFLLILGVVNRLEFRDAQKTKIKGEIYP